MAFALPRRFLLSGLCAAGVLSPALAQVPGREPKLAIKGYDTVAYFTVGKPTKGDPRISQVWDGSRFLFANEENRRLFATNPDKYAPQFSGNCAASLSHGVKIDAEPENWIISGGRLFLFAAPVGLDKQRLDPSLVARADENWKRLH